MEEVISESAPVNSGVPQGYVLGLLLSLVCITYLLAQVKLKTHLLADDYLLYRKIGSQVRDLDSLQ